MLPTENQLSCLVVKCCPKTNRLWVQSPAASDQRLVKTFPRLSALRVGLRGSITQWSLGAVPQLPTAHSSGHRSNVDTNVRSFRTIIGTLDWNLIKVMPNICTTYIGQRMQVPLHYLSGKTWNKHLLWSCDTKLNIFFFRFGLIAICDFFGVMFPLKN